MEKFRHIVKRQKKLFRMANQEKLVSFRLAPRYKYGFMVPRNYEHAKILDKVNNNIKRQESTDLEMSQLDEHGSFINHGIGKTAPQDYTIIKTHLIYEIKHDGRHKSRYVVDGHLADIPIDSIYSGLVSLRDLRIMLFLAKLNTIDIWATDIGNTYLEAKTSEKVYIITGPEFGEK